MRHLALLPRRDESGMEARRLAAVPRWRRGEPLAAIARSLGVSRQAVHKWAHQYRRRGAAGLRRRPRPGRPPKLARAQLAQLPPLLAQGAEAYGFPTPVWTTQRVADLIWQPPGCVMTATMSAALLHRCGWILQSGTARRARERDEEAIQRWVQHT